MFGKSFSDIAKPFKDAFNLAAEGFDPASGDQGFFKNLKNNLKALNFNQSLEKLTIGSKAAAVGMKLLSTAANIGVSMAISAAITAVYKLTQVSKDVANAAQDSANSFNTSKDSLDSYKDKVEELREKMNSSSSSIADVSDARKELLSIQTEMIKKFGDEESSVKAITDAINGQASAWDVLAKKQWDSSLNDFLTSGGKYAEFMNWLEGYNNNIDRMKDEYGSYSVNLGTANVSDDKLSQLEDIISKVTGSGLDSYNSFNFSGTASDVYDTLTTIKAAIKDSGVDFGSEFSNILENAISDAKSTSAKYKDMYDNYVLNEQILGKDNNRAKDYSSEYNKIVSAYDDYQKAQTEGDTTKIEKAKEAYAKAVSEGMDVGAAEGDTRVVEYFQSMYPELKDIVASWQFDVNFKVGSVSENNLKDTLSKFNGYTTEDLLNFDYGNASQDQKNAYNELTRYAQQSNLSTEDYIKLLQKKGYINSDLYTRTIDRFGKYYKNGTERRSYNSKDSKRLEDFLASQGIKNDDAKLKSFNETTKNATTVDEAINLWNESQKKTNEAKKSSFKDAWAGLDNNEDYKNTKKEILELAEAGKLTDETFAKADGGNAKKYFDSMNISAEEAVKKINETIDSAKKLSNLKSSITSIRTAYTEKKENKVASADTLESMESEFGNLKSWKKYKQTLGSTTSSLEECRKAQNKLATEYINSNAFLDNIVDSTGKVDAATKQYYVSQLSDLGIKNAEAVVNDKIAQQLVNVNLKKKEFADVTEADIQELVNEGSQYGVTEAAIKKYVFQKYLANKNSLSTSKSVSNLITLAKQAGITGNALEALMQLESDLSSFEDIQKEWENNPSGSHAEDTKRTAQTQFWKNKIKQDKKNVKKYAKTEVKTGGGSGGTGADVGANDPNKNTKNTGGGGNNSKSSDSKTQFDWIERRITNLQTRFDRWKTIIENSSLKFIDKYYKKATSYAKKLVNTEGSAYTKYLKKANGVKLNKSLKAKVRNGKISGKTSNLIKEYGSKTADKIQKYQDYYEKATSALDSFVEKAQELYNLPLDKASAKIEKFSDAIDLLEKKLDNAITATAKNKIIDDEVKEKKNTYDANKSANNKTQKNLKSAGNELKKSVGRKQKKSITKAVKNGKEVDLAKFKEGSKAYKAAVKYNAALNAKTKAQQEKDVSEQEYNYYKDIEAPKTKFDNVKDEYENKLTVIDARIQDLDNQIDNIEASGATVDNSFYREKKKQTDQKKALLIEEKNRLTESLKGIKKYSAEWYTANDEINKVNDSIAECTKTQYELNDAIAEGNKKIFEKKLEGYQRIIDEQDFLLGLIEHEDSVDSDTGVRTDAGNARLHSYTADYYASDEKVNIATAERQRLESMKAAKEYGVGYEYSSLEALNNAINDTIKTQQENIASKYSIEKKIVDEVTKSYQAQMTVLQKLIDKKKEQLETEKD
nr:MAG TPA: chromosome segregation protein [Bacteriophage sp.]